MMSDLLRNFSDSEQFDENSFISKFHELHTWDDQEYWKVDSAIYMLAEKYKNENVIPRDIAWPIFQIFSYLMMSFEAHYNGNDFFEIHGLDTDELFQRRERIQLVFEGFFKGEMIPNESFDYCNPNI